MKTQNDILRLKAQETQLFDNAYMFLIERLTDYYLSKQDGKERITQELNEWDNFSQKIILGDLSKNLEKYNLTLQLDI